jgi:hypothetical protein
LIRVVSRHGDGLNQVTGGLRVLELDPVGAPIIVSPTFLYFFLRVRTNDRLLRYLYAATKSTRARLVLGTDAISQLTELKNLLPHVEVVAVMHGFYVPQPENGRIREAWTETKKSDVVLFSLGQHDLINYRRWGNIHSRIIPVGGLNDSLYRELYGEASQQRFDICVVEGSVDPNATKTFAKIRLANWMKITEYVNQLASTKNLNVVIALSKSSKQDEVRQWFISRFDREITFVDSTEEFGTYRAIDASAISIGEVSTSLIEGLGRGNKVVALNFTNSELLDLPIHEINRMKNPTFSQFEMRYTELVEMNIDAYKQLTESSTNFVISYAPNRPTHVVLREFIESSIAESSSERS